MKIAIQIIESLLSAFHALLTNKVRSFLSILSISIGIFVIISILSIIDSMENNIKKSLTSLGGEVIYIEKWPWSVPEGETEYPMWKYQNRPVPTLKELRSLLRRDDIIENAAYKFTFNKVVSHYNDYIENAPIIATTFDMINVWNLQIERGRYFTEKEMNGGASVAIIGIEIAQKLFHDINPIGKNIKIQGMRFLIIGVYKKKGIDIIGGSMDNYINISANKSLYLIRSSQYDMGQSICVKAKRNIEHDQFMAELEGIMRSIRNLKPLQENDFALNEVTMLSNRFTSVFSVLSINGWIIGGFSILVGGFGIANIMFVSVKERTKIIGIQKSLGAKKSFILFQFLFESVLLSVIGSLGGLIFTFIIIQFINYSFESNFSLTIDNIFRGIILAMTIGLSAGVLPAISAANMDPIKAINSI